MKNEWAAVGEEHELVRWISGRAVFVFSSSVRVLEQLPERLSTTVIERQKFLMVGFFSVCFPVAKE